MMVVILNLNDLVFGLAKLQESQPESSLENWRQAMSHAEVHCFVYAGDDENPKNVMYFQ